MWISPRVTGWSRYPVGTTIFTHISARVPGPDHHFLINPYGLLFEEITASSLVKVDIDGRKVIGAVRHRRIHDPQCDPCGA